MTPTLSIVAIVARDGAIGRCGDQPFHISADFRRFKALTIGKPIVMGRKTFEALPKGALPGRRNIVVTRNKEWNAPGVETASSVEDALTLCADVPEVMIIGGGEIYRQSMPLSSRLYLTEVDATVPDADTYFPERDPAGWEMTECSAPETDPNSGLTYRFTVYIRKHRM